MEEATWKQGKRHGFSRQINSSGVVLQLLEEGAEVARFYLNNNFERFAIRGSKKELLEDFGPLDLLPENSVWFNNNKGVPWEDFPTTNESKDSQTLKKSVQKSGFAKIFNAQSNK